MKIVAIIQLYNEVSSGMLPQFCSRHEGLFDNVIALDDGSTDGTSEYCRAHGFRVIRRETNDFKAEIFHRKSLLAEADKLDPDFIIMLDADEIVTVDRAKLEKICSELGESEFNGFEANYVNLWRSNFFKRTDSLFDELKPVKLWQHRKGVDPFPAPKTGLHQRLYPEYVESTTYRDDLIFIHTGFATAERIVDKFVRYRAAGQTGFELMRFIDESKLCLERVPSKLLPESWGGNESQPEALLISDYISLVEESKERVFKPKVTIFSLIYKDVGWLQFMYQQFLKYTPLDGVEFYFIANDADDSVLAYMRENYIPFYDFKNTESHRQEHYINNVYRAYNFGVSQAKGDYVVLLNSDMAFSEGWLDSLLKYCETGVVVASRLIEQGKLKTGKHGIEKNFGNSWESFDEVGFQEYANSIKDDRIESGGLYMPLLVSKKDFNAVGGYPEGNVVPGSDPFIPVIAEPGAEVVSGDAIFIEKMELHGVRHTTAFDSIVYHFQEGERRADLDTYSDIKSPVIAIANDSIIGINGEKTLWGHLLDLPKTVLLDYKKVGGKTPRSFVDYILSNKIDLEVVLQNATFIPRFFSDKRTLVYLQDNLRAMGRPSVDQEINLKMAECRITNTVDTASSYPEYDFDICPVGVDAELFKPCNKSVVRSKYGIALDETVGIFVGALNEVKGWSEVKSIIESEPGIKWIVVSKYEQSYTHPNLKFFSKQPQSVLVELLNASDFFVLGSPVETQCLAAIEAAFCNVPVVMKPVGIFAHLSDSEKGAVGSIQVNLLEGVKDVLANSERFSPRDTLLGKGLSLNSTSERWYEILVRERMKALSSSHRDKIITQPVVSWRRKIAYKAEVFYRFSILRPLLNRDTFYSAAELSVYIRDKLPSPFYKLLRFLWRILRK